MTIVYETASGIGEDIELVLFTMPYANSTRGIRSCADEVHLHSEEIKKAFDRNKFESAKKHRAQFEGWLKQVRRETVLYRASTRALEYARSRMQQLRLDKIFSPEFLFLAFIEKSAEAHLQSVQECPFPSLHNNGRGGADEDSAESKAACAIDQSFDAIELFDGMENSGSMPNAKSGSSNKKTAVGGAKHGKITTFSMNGGEEADDGGNGLGAILFTLIACFFILFPTSRLIACFFILFPTSRSHHHKTTKEKHDILPMWRHHSMRRLLCLIFGASAFVYAEALGSDSNRTNLRLHPFLLQGNGDITSGFHLRGSNEGTNIRRNNGLLDHVAPVLSEVNRRTSFKGYDHHISSRALSAPNMTWGCKPHSKGPQDLVDASNFITNEIMPALHKVKTLQSVPGTRGLVSWLDILRSINNPWCIVRGKTFTKWGRRAVETSKTIEKGFLKGMKVPVVRNYIKKAKFLGLETLAKKIIDVDNFLTKKCQEFDRTARRVIENIMDRLSDLAMIASMISLLVLPLLQSTICGINNILVTIGFIYGYYGPDWPDSDRRHLQVDPTMDVRTAFLRLTDHIDDPGIKPVILKLLDLNAAHIAGKSVLDFFIESANMGLNMTEVGHRYLSYKEDSVDMAALKDAFDSINNVSSRFKDIDSQLEIVYETIVAPAQSFANDLVQPFEDIGRALEPFQPVLDVIGEVVDALSFLKCPDALGFVCDLDAIIVDFVEDLVAKTGLDINAIIDEVGDKISDLLNVPSTDAIELGLPDFDLGVDDFLNDFENQIAGLLTTFTFNPVATAFDESGERDHVKDRVSLEFRYSSSATSSTQVGCPTGKFPYVLSATRRTARCANDDFTGTVATPCGTDSGPCDVRGSEYGLATCDIAPQPSFFNVPGVSGADMFDMTNVLYTCVNEADLDKLDPLPGLSQADGESIACSPDQVIVIDDAEALEPCFVASYRTANQQFCTNFELLEGPPEHPLNVHPNLYEFFAYAKLQVRDGHWPGILDTWGFENARHLMTLLLGVHYREACCAGESFCLDSVCSWAYPLYETWNSEPLDPYVLGFKKPFLIYFTRKSELGKYDEIRNEYLPLKAAIQDQLPSCIEAVKSQCEDQPLANCDFSGSCSVSPYMLVTHTCLVEGRDTSIQGTNLYTGIAFKNATGSLASVELGCPESGGYIQVTEVQSGAGLGTSNVPFTGCDGQTGPCYVRMSDLGRNDETMRIRYECRCGIAYNPLPDSSSGLCVKCTAGTYRDSIDMEDCELCPPGTFSAEGAEICEECPPGTYTTGEGNTFCNECLPGTYNALTGQSSSDACLPCELNTYNDVDSSVSCDPCPAGQYTPDEGSTSCADVPAGYYSPGLRRLSTSNTGADNHSRLLPGNQAPPGALPCPLGQSSSALGATSCQDCSPGMYANRLGSHVCEPCPLDTYSPSSGSESCTICPPGTSTFALGKDSPESCTPIPAPINYLSTKYQNYSCRELLLLDVDETDYLILEEIATRRLNQVGDSVCNRGPWNTPQCAWDKGDCCPHTCIEPPEDPDESINTGALELRCSYNTMECRDPSVAGTPFGACDDEDNTGNNTILDRALNDAIPRGSLGDGYCDDELNYAEFQYDGGDCCWETCSVSPEDKILFPSSCESDWTSTCKNPTAPLEDTEAPVLQISPAQSSKTVSVHMIPLHPTASAVDNDPCFDGEVNYTEDRIDGRCPNEFSLIRTWASEDDSGNEAIESIVITVVDSTPPTVSNKAYCIEINKEQPMVGDSQTHPVEHKNIMRKWVRIDLPTVAQEVCGYVAPSYCNRSVQLRFLSCASSHEFTSKSKDGLPDCFFLDSTEEVFLYVDTKSTSEKTHRIYTLDVEYTDVCDNSANATFTYIIPNNHTTLDKPVCSDGTLSFEENQSFDLCDWEVTACKDCVDPLTGILRTCPEACVQEAKALCLAKCTVEEICSGSFPPGQVESGTPNEECAHCINQCVKDECQKNPCEMFTSRKPCEKTDGCEWTLDKCIEPAIPITKSNSFGNKKNFAKSIAKEEPPSPSRANAILPVWTVASMALLWLQLLQ